MTSLLESALKCENKNRPPVWLMRQAGRYLPDYRALRERHSLNELFHNSELAAEITRMPVDLLGVDAAILFSDITTIVEALGLQLDFIENVGPRISPLIETPDDLKIITPHSVEEKLSFVKKQIELLLPTLSVPLIGFCGGPFTVASYMIERSHREKISATKKWLYNDPQTFHHLLELITEASIEYLRMQIKAGVSAIQIFDTWASALAYPQFVEFSLRYLKQIVDALRETEIPIILFGKGFSLFAHDLAKLKPAAISFDWQKELIHLRQSLPSHIAVQGNIDPYLLLAPRATIRAMTERLLDSMRHEMGFIVNLGHGVLPETPVANVEFFIDTVKQYTAEPLFI
jgi:uroporphyrinogen decarboxylase